MVLLLLLLAATYYLLFASLLRRSLAVYNAFFKTILKATKDKNQ
jgi:hypothetical protein